MIHLDAEFIIADALADYLKSVASEGLQTASPIVTFYDPMSVEEMDRVVVQCPTGATDEDAAGNGEFNLVIGQRTRWTQANVAYCVAVHRERLKEIRSLMAVDDLITLLDAAAEGAIGFNFVKYSRTLETKITDAGWIYSETGYTVYVYTKEETE